MMSPLLALFLFLFLLLPLVILYRSWWVPVQLQQLMESRQIRGPGYKFFHGNTKEIMEMKQKSSKTAMDLSHDIFPRTQPHFYSWFNLYGKNFLYWIGTEPQIVVTEPELIKEILSNREGNYPKNKQKSYMKKLLGDGIVATEGEKWVKLRKVANHAFHGESLQSMVPAMISCAETMLEKWRRYECKEIEQKAKSLAFRRLIRTKDETEVERMEQLLHANIMEIVKKRQDEVTKGQAASFGTDFLGSLLKAHHDTDEKNRIQADEIIDECKTFYFAGQETTYSLLSWSTLLLAIHTDWQEKARDEVFKLFGNDNPNSEGIARLNIVNMIIYETLRLYSPVTLITRRTENRVMMGKYEFPANVTLAIVPQALHRNPDIWGADAHLFKPERFAEGLAKAAPGNKMAFLGFGFGPRMCVGLNFAINEAKIALSMILQRYKFTLSQNYVHSPFIVLTAQPQHGVQILLQPL